MVDKQDRIETISINGNDYVPVDSGKQVATRPDGLTYCIVRGYRMGVVCGFVDYDNATREGFDIYEGRQMYRWDSAFVLADLAESGVRDPDNCKFSEPQNCQKAFDPYQVFRCTEKSHKTLVAVKNANR